MIEEKASNIRVPLYVALYMKPNQISTKKSMFTWLREWTNTKHLVA